MAIGAAGSKQQHPSEAIGANRSPTKLIKRWISIFQRHFEQPKASSHTFQGAVGAARSSTKPNQNMSLHLARALEANNDVFQGQLEGLHQTTLNDELASPDGLGNKQQQLSEATGATRNSTKPL